MKKSIITIGIVLSIVSCEKKGAVVVHKTVPTFEKEEMFLGTYGGTKELTREEVLALIVINDMPELFDLEADEVSGISSEELVLEARINIVLGSMKKNQAAKMVLVDGQLQYTLKNLNRTTLSRMNEGVDPIAKEERKDSNVERNTTFAQRIKREIETEGCVKLVRLGKKFFAYTCSSI